MTPEQASAASKQALAKIKSQDVERKVVRTEWYDNNEVTAIIKDEMGGLSKAELIKNRHLYSRAGFARLLTRANKKDPGIGSDSNILENYSRQVSFMHFNATEAYPVDRQQKEILEEMHDSVVRGTLKIGDYNKLKKQMEDQNKEQFRAQPYREAKETLFVGILATLSPENVAEIQAAGLNMTGFMLTAMGQNSNISALAMNAFNDLNSYMRASGSKAKPLEWWADNKDNYTATATTVRNNANFLESYPSDSVTNDSGTLNLVETKSLIIRKYPMGPERDKRSAALRGIK